jgi:hypothetical protein
MASAISADESFEQAITMVLRGDENTDNGLYSRVNLFVSHRHPRQRCRALKDINCVRFQTAQARLANASDDLSYTERARWLKRLSDRKLREKPITGCGSSERAPHCNICCGSMSPQEDQWLSAVGSNHPATKHRNLK